MSFVDSFYHSSHLFSRISSFYEYEKERFSHSIHDFENKVGFEVSRYLPDGRQWVRALQFGHPRLEFTKLFRPNGGEAKQMVASAGFFLGRLAARFTLQDAPKFPWPTALHFETILGIKPWSIGASIGVSWNPREFILNWFSRRQFSVRQTGRDLYRWVASSTGNRFYRMGEIKYYDFKLAMNEVGHAISYQFSREHYREAYLLLKKEGLDRAISFLKSHYSHIDEGTLRSLLTTPLQSGKIFLAEFATLLGLGVTLKKILPEGKIGQSIQQGASYAVSNLFRIGVQAGTALKAGVAVAEAVPITAIHWGLSTVHQKAEKAFHWSHSTFRSIVFEDFGSLALYAGLKSFFTPDRLRQFGQAAVAGGTALIRFTPWILPYAPWVGVGVIALGVGAYYLYEGRREKHPLVQVELAVSAAAPVSTEIEKRLLTSPSEPTLSISSQKLDRAEAVLNNRVHFDFNDAHVNSNDFKILEEVTNRLLMGDLKKKNIRILGYADSTGSDVYNQTLSLERAISVRDYLIRKGIDPNRLEVNGYGESSPIADNRTGKGRAQNRRVTFEVLFK